MKLDVLAISAHPDDVEVAAGGTLLHHIALGQKVGLLDLTKGELSSRGNVPQRTEEAYNAAQLLGASIREQLDLPDGYFTTDESSLLKVVSKIRKYRPDYILANAFDDRHPDHRRAADMVVQASFLAGLIKVETSDNGINQATWRTKAIYHYIQDRTCKPDFMIDVTPYMERKFLAIKAFKSQFYLPDCNDPETPISCPSFFEALRGRNAMLGRQVGVEYAEGFTTTRPLGVNNFAELY
jgi:N-acetylglucosamine malate deacetylase 1